MAAVDRWSLTRRAAQLVVAPALSGRIAALASTLAEGVGGVLILGSAAADLQSQIARGQSLASLPLLVMADQEGGGVQRLGSLVSSLPWARTMASSMSADAVEAAAAQVGRQMHALGVGMDLAPVLDLDARDGPSDSNPDGQRSFSVEPATARTYGLAFTRGLRQAGVAAVVKHFPGLGGAANTDVGPASTAPLADLRRSALLPFAAAIGDGVPAVMVSHASVPGLTTAPASLSLAAVSGLLRGELGFHGLVLTDSLSAGAVSAAGYSVPSAAVAAVAAGDDMLLFGSTLTPADTRLLSPDAVAATVAAIAGAVVTAVQRGNLPSSRLNDAVLHVLAVKHVDPCTLAP